MTGGEGPLPTAKRATCSPPSFGDQIAAQRSRAQVRREAGRLGVASSAGLQTLRGDTDRAGYRWGRGGVLNTCHMCRGFSGNSGPPNVLPPPQPAWGGGARRHWTGDRG